jgi:hypothetical protein
VKFSARVPVFDANVGVGHRHDRPAPFESPTDLLKEMDRHGVERALIYHVQGESISSIDANKALTQWLEDDRLSPQWVLGTDDDSLGQLRDLRADGRLNCVRLHDAGGSVPLVDWVYGESLDWLMAEGVPLWISLVDAAAKEVVELLRPFPDLDVALLGAHYVHASLVRGILRTLPRARLELSRYEVLGGAEALVREFGAHRLLYGSYYPRYAMGPMLYYLHQLDFTEMELAAVCAGNLQDLLGTGEGKLD